MSYNKPPERLYVFQAERAEETSCALFCFNANTTDGQQNDTLYVSATALKELMKKWESEYRFRCSWRLKLIQDFLKEDKK